MPTAHRYVKGQTDFNSNSLYSSGSKPSNGDNSDTLTFDEGGPVPSWSNTAALAGVRFAQVIGTPGFTGILGAANAYVEFDVDHDADSKFDWQGREGAFIKGGSTNATFSNIFWRPTGPAICYVINATVSNLEVGSGGIQIPSTVVLGTVYGYGTGQIDIREHASDTIAGFGLMGAAVMTTRRRLASAGTVGPNCTLIIDVDSTTLSGTITNYGTVIVRNGSVAIDNRGTCDYSQLAKTGYTLTITDWPGSVEKQGPVAFTTVNRTTKGSGGTKITV